MVDAPLESVGLTIAGLLLLGFLCQWLAWRVQLPAILFLLLAGIGLGPVSGFLDPDAFLGPLLFPTISLGVAVILFEGALSLRLEETRGIQAVIRNLVTVGVVITWLGMAAAAHWLADLAWPLALLFGALVSVTGPTVIVPLLRTVRPTARVANVLRWEGILIDPIGALLVVFVYELIAATSRSEPALAFVLLIAAGLGFGTAGAQVLAFTLRRHWIPEYLRNFATLAWMLTIFALANQVVHESGLLAVTMMGIVLANMRDLHVEDIVDFKEHLTVLLLSVLFLLLGARVNLELIFAYGGVALALLLVAKVLVRPLAVVVSAIGSQLTGREQALLAWIAPRGIVAAAVAALFELRLADQGVPQADLLVPLVFAMIIGTVVIESATARPLARALGVSAAGEDGVLIVGANQVGMELAAALKALGIRTLIADSDYGSIAAARLRGFETWYGSVLSDRADRTLDLTGLTRLFAVTRNAELNTFICSRYRPEFGIENCFMLLFSKERDRSEHRALAPALRSHLLFGPDVSWTQLASLLSNEGAIRITRLTKDFDLEAYGEEHGSDVVLLFAVSSDGRLRVYGESERFEPGPGWRLCALVKPKDGTRRPPLGAEPTPQLPGAPPG